MKRLCVCSIFVLAMMTLPQFAKAACTGKTWTANAGAETKDEGVQGDGFFPNEVWISANDCIEWTFVPKNEVHTVTFLKSGQLRPDAPFPVGPPGPPPPIPGQFGASGCTAYAAGTTASYSGSACVSSDALAGSTNFTVTFPTPGNYKLVCLVHTDMNGTVHVLSSTASLPYGQYDYDKQARDEAKAVLGEDDHRRDDRDHDWDHNEGNRVLAGIGDIVATGGGLQYRAVVRYLPGTVRIHAGESVTWTNVDPTEPHTVTFGTEPPNFTVNATSNLGSTAVDGTLTATTNCATKSVCDTDYQPDSKGTFVSTAFISSGFIEAQAPDRTGSAQLPPGTTRITITFPVKGDYYYHCTIHDVDGMYGEVIVE